MAKALNAGFATKVDGRARHSLFAARRAKDAMLGSGRCSIEGGEMRNTRETTRGGDS